VLPVRSSEVPRTGWPTQLFNLSWLYGKYHPFHRMHRPLMD